ncbi:MAG TPA: LTA synthase family protein [Bacteroidales bacterium]|nr:LTA synthase family protein [Bacteroidales bacterium]
MRSRLLFLLRYYAFWIIVFISQKIFFMLFNYRESFQLKISTWLLVIWNGLKLDLSAGAYILLIPVIAILLGVVLGTKFLRVFMNVYTLVILFIVLLLGVVDMDLYSYWGFKLDITPLIYVKTPGDALASVGIIEITLFLLFLLGLYFLFYRLYRTMVRPSALSEGAGWWQVSLMSLLILALLVIPARGGFGIAPMNVGAVYFSPKRFANHSAINVLWNTIYSITERDKLEEDHHYMAPKKADTVFNNLMKEPGRSPSEIVVKKNANIMLVILESFSDKIISSLGGEDGITPVLNSLYDHSLVFGNFYASGDRSDKGMTSIFSGFPAQPTTSIIDYPAKSQDLPFLYRDFSAKNYHTAFYYGGDLNFANFRAYFSNPYLDRVITVDDFPDSLATQKWGVPDQYLFDRILKDINETKGRFFYSCFTLSSHEPFDVPGEPVFGTATRDDLCRNAFHYTDECLGHFLDSARHAPWWDQTLIIFVADHGSRSPGNTPNHVEKKFRIPMIWTGGALLKDSVVNKTGSQTDIPATLLAQFGFNHDEYPYSKDLLNAGSPAFAFYAFNNGFGFKTDSSFVIWDNVYGKAIETKGQGVDQAILKGKAFLQKVSADFLKK